MSQTITELSPEQKQAHRLVAFSNWYEDTDFLQLEQCVRNLMLDHVGKEVKGLPGWFYDSIEELGDFFEFLDTLLKLMSQIKPELSPEQKHAKRRAAFGDWYRDADILQLKACIRNLVLDRVIKEEQEMPWWFYDSGQELGDLFEFLDTLSRLS